MALLVLLGLAAAVGLWLVGAYNGLVNLRQRCKQAFSDINVQLKQRHDLVPNLVETVKGAAAFERDTLEAVVNARSRVAQTQVPADVLTNPEAFKTYEQNQAALTGALSRLLVVVEKYPDLKANQNFLALQSQLEGTENRIAVSRRDYIEAVRRYNTEIKTFPGRIWKIVLYGSAQPMQTFTISEEAKEAPKVKF